MMSQKEGKASDGFGYWHDSKCPLQSLIFLLPLVLVYELGLLRYGLDHLRQVSRDIFARRLLYDFFEWFGISGYYLPGLIVIVALLSLHLVRRDRWRFKPRVYVGMGFESFVLAVPLFVFGLVAPLQHTVIAPVLERVGEASLHDQISAFPWQAGLVFGIGAGIYEEFVFRMIGLALLHALLADVLRLPERWSATMSIVLSAVAFSLYHFSFDGRQPFVWSLFIFYAFAGVYFAGLYLMRGFGVVAGTHAIYNVLVVLFRMMERGGG